MHNDTLRKFLFFFECNGINVFDCIIDK